MRFRLAGLGVAVAAFGFQQTAVIPAIPAIQRAFGASQSWSAWLQTGYLIASCVLTPLAGKLGDRAGKRRLLLGSLISFLLGSAGAAAAPSLPVLIGCRILQGGGGAVFPLALSITRDELPRERRAGAIGLLTGAFGLGTALGFAAGGALVQLLGWRWIFIVGGAAVALAIGAALATVPAREGRNRGGMGWAGAALFTGGVTLVLVALTEGTALGWLSAPVIGGVVAGVLLIAGWGRHDRRAAVPLLDLRVLASRTVLLANLATIALGFMLFGTFFLVPYLVQGSGAHGYGLAGDTLESGLFLVPSALGELLTGPLAPRLARLIEAKRVYALGLALAVAGDVLLAVAHVSGVEIAVGSLLTGAGAGLAIGIASDVIAESASEQETGIAMSLNSVLRRVGGGIGGQIAAALLAGLVVSGQPSNAAFTLAFAVAAAVGAVGAGLAAGIPTGERTAS